jgi:hypothetical protein
MLVLKKGNRNTKSLAYTSLLLPVLEYGAECWDSSRERHINALYRAQTKGDQFSNLLKFSDWENLAKRWMIARLFALFKSYSGERARKAIRDRSRRSSFSSRVDHYRKIRDRKQTKLIGKHSFVNWTIKNWNQLPGEAFGTFCLDRNNKGGGESVAKIV